MHDQVHKSSMSSSVLSATHDGMTRAEVRASVSLASVFALRMVALLLIYPVFAVHAKTLHGGENAVLVGLALGIFGLTQALAQLPFGMASDRFGRKRVIVIGLLLFAAGSFVAATATSIHMVIVGRAIQGVGAISAAVMALVADFTRAEQRTKAMAMIGAAIGLSFAASVVLASPLYRLIGMDGIFILMGALAFAAIAVVLFVVPQAPAMVKAARVPFVEILKNKQLMRLNYGVFALHAGMMTMFLVLPPVLVESVGIPIEAQWKLYLPVMAGSFLLMLPPIFLGERRGRMKQVFVGAIAVLALVQCGFIVMVTGSALPWHAVLLLLGFFTVFNILEASQPSLVSRIAPASARGAALGVYNTLQPLGLFCGSVLGGWLLQVGGPSWAFVGAAALTFAWLIIALNMQNLPRRDSKTSAAPV
jgi:MFS family permease